MSNPTRWLQSILLTISSQCTSITLSVAVSQFLHYERIADIVTYVLVYSPESQLTTGILHWPIRHNQMGICRPTWSLCTDCRGRSAEWISIWKRVTDLSNFAKFERDHWLGHRGQCSQISMGWLHQLCVSYY